MQSDTTTTTATHVPVNVPKNEEDKVREQKAMQKASYDWLSAKLWQSDTSLTVNTTRYVQLLYYCSIVVLDGKVLYKKDIDLQVDTTTTPEPTNAPKKDHKVRD